MAIYVKVNNEMYPATISGRICDEEWDNRNTKSIKLEMPYTDAISIFVDGISWSIVHDVEREVEKTVEREVERQVERKVERQEERQVERFVEREIDVEVAVLDDEGNPVLDDSGNAVTQIEKQTVYDKVYETVYDTVYDIEYETVTDIVQEVVHDIVIEQDVFDNSDYCLAGNVIDHRNGYVTVKMGMLTEVEILKNQLTNTLTEEEVEMAYLEGVNEA